MPQFFGSFTGALFTGALPILAVFFVCTGASIDFRATPYILKKGGTLFGVKVGIGILLGLVFGRLLGEAPITAGVFAGISTLAIVAAMNDTNGGLYMALMGQYGHPRDVGAYTRDVARIRPVPDDGDSRRRGTLRISVADAGWRHPAAARRHAASATSIARCANS